MNKFNDLIKNASKVLGRDNILRLKTDINLIEYYQWLEDNNLSNSDIDLNCSLWPYGDNFSYPVPEPIPDVGFNPILSFISDKAKLLLFLLR